MARKTAGYIAGIPYGHQLTISLMHFRSGFQLMRLERKQNTDQVLWLLHPHGRCGRSFRFLASTWPTPSRCGDLSESADGESERITICSFFFYATDFQINPGGEKKGGGGEGSSRMVQWLNVQLVRTGIPSGCQFHYLPKTLLCGPWKPWRITQSGGMLHWHG